MRQYFLRSQMNDFEPLEKSTKQYKQMLGGDIAPHQEAFDVAKMMPNSNWGSWVIKNYKKDPQKFHDHKERLIHFSGMTAIPDVAETRMEPHDTYESGLAKLDRKVYEHTKLHEKGRRIFQPNKTTKKILDVGNGLAWYSLGVPACGDESSAMVHCGNQPTQKPYHDLLSLRESDNLRGKEYHEPYLTFVNDKENNLLGEMKGYNNSIPAPEYHEAIAKLLAQGYVPIGGGSEAHKNFHIDHLSPELANYVAQHNPEAFAMSEKYPELAEKALNSLL